MWQRYLPDGQNMTIRIKVCIFEPSRIFQSKAKHPVKSNVGKPDQSQCLQCLVSRCDRETRQEKGPMYV